MAIDYKIRPGKELNVVKYLEHQAKISIIITNDNNSLDIKDTLYSILNQTFPHFEIFISKNLGEEETNNLEKLDKRIKIADLSDINNLIEKKLSVDSEYVLLIDSDYLLDKTYLETAYFTLVANKEASWAYGNYIDLENKQEFIKKFNIESIKQENIVGGCALIKRECFKKIKLTSEIKEWTLWLTLLEKGFVPVHLSYHNLYKKHLKGDNKEFADTISSKINFSKYIIEYPRENYNWNHLKEQLHGLIYPRIVTNKTNILLIIPWMILGGADKFNLDLIRLINKDKYHITIITTNPCTYKLRQEFEKYADEIFDLSTFSDCANWNIFIDYVIKTRKINIILNTNSIYGYQMIPYLKAKNPNVPIFDYIHAEEWHKRNGGYSRDSAVVTSLLDKTLFCNKKSEGILHDFFKVDKDKLKTIYIGVDTDKFDITKYDIKALKKEKNIDDDKTNVGFICRLVLEKRPWLFVEIAKETIKRDKNIRFIVGGDGPLLKPIMDKVKELNLTDNIIFLGNVTEPEKFYSICDMTFNCSIKEGLALTTYESLSMGIPVISADVGGQKELISSDVGVVLPLFQEEKEIMNFNYSQDEIEQYVDAILKVKENNNSYKENAREKIVKSFSLDCMIKNMEEEIENIIENPNEEAIRNGKQLDSNIRIVLEYLNHFFMTFKYEYRYLCDEYIKNTYLVDDKKSKIKNIIKNNLVTIKKFFKKIKLEEEYVVIKNLIKNIIKVLLAPIQLIIIEIKRFRNKK